MTYYLLFIFILDIEMILNKKQIQVIFFIWMQNGL